MAKTVLCLFPGKKLLERVVSIVKVEKSFRFLIVLLSVLVNVRIIDGQGEGGDGPKRFLADLRNEKDSNSIDEVVTTMNDIVFSLNQQREIYLGTLDLYRYRWRSSTIPVQISDQFRPQEKILVWQTLAHIEEKTCIRFIPRRGTDINYVHLTKQYWAPIESNLGMVEGVQNVNVHSANYADRYLILHLFMHTLGFPHQHIVPNRDDFVEVKWENIALRHRSEFIRLSKLPKSEIFEEYDVQSVMHYDSYSGTKNGKPTMKTKDGKILKPSVTLTDIDYKKLNLFYGCD